MLPDAAEVLDVVALRKLRELELLREWNRRVAPRILHRVSWLVDAERWRLRLDRVLFLPSFATERFKRCTTLALQLLRNLALQAVEVDLLTRRLLQPLLLHADGERQSHKLGTLLNLRHSILDRLFNLIVLSLRIREHHLLLRVLLPILV